MRSTEKRALPVLLRVFDNALAKRGGKNVKAIAALFDLDALKASRNQDTDIASALESLKKDTDYLYGSDQPISNLAGRTGNSW